MTELTEYQHILLSYMLNYQFVVWKVSFLRRFFFFFSCILSRVILKWVGTMTQHLLKEAKLSAGYGSEERWLETRVDICIVELM